MLALFDQLLCHLETWRLPHLSFGHTQRNIDPLLILCIRISFFYQFLTLRRISDKSYYFLVSEFSKLLQRFPRGNTRVAFLRNNLAVSKYEGYLRATFLRSREQANQCNKF